MEVSQYLLSVKLGHTLDLSIHADGARSWSVSRRSDGHVLNKYGVWEWEPRPSERDAPFYERCRFATPADGLAAWELWASKIGGEG